MLKFFTSIILGFIFPYWVLANTPQVVSVSVLPDDFVFDGIPSEAGWASIPSVELVVQSPVYKGTPSQKTVIKLAYDQNYIYLAGSLFDTEPEKIPLTTKLRDGGDESTDWFGLVIDSYNDNQNALSFFTTPTGSRFDAAILNDANATGGTDPMNLSWNNFWDVKTSITDEGWFAEMRIPFSSLQFQTDENGSATMGITIWRYIARNNETHISPDISPDFGPMGVFRPSLAKEYVFHSISQKKPFYITPYLLSGFESLHHLDDAHSAYVADNRLVRSAGLDVKYGITNNFTLDLSLNTDFAQVEADDQQINLTRFSLFFPEKRLFFQERSGIFSFGFGSNNNLFYSRRIGIDDNGNPIPILGGARVTGRTGDLDIGFLSMQTRATDNFQSNNYTVFRVKKRIINDNSDIGALITNKIAPDGSFNTVYGVDSRINVWGDDFLRIQFAQAINDGIESDYTSLEPSLFWLSLSRSSDGGFTYGVSISRIGEDFNSEVGFIERLNYTRFGTRFQYNWYPGENSYFFKHGPSIRGSSFLDNFDNSYNSGSYRASYAWTLKNGMTIDAGTRLQFDDIKEPFTLAGVADVPIGDYFYQSYNVEFNTPTVYQYRLIGSVESGPFFDGYKNSFLLSPVYNISSSLSLSGSYEFNQVMFDERNTLFIAHIARIKALVMFSTKLSISSFIQYNSIDHLWLGNIRFRYNPAEGNDLFIVYNTDANAQRSFYTPHLPLSNQSTILVKYSYTFKL